MRSRAFFDSQYRSQVQLDSFQEVVLVNNAGSIQPTDLWKKIPA